MVHFLSAESAALVESNVELVVVPSRAIDVDAVQVVHISRAVHQSSERSIEVNTDFHVLIRAFSGDVCQQQWYLWSPQQFNSCESSLSSISLPDNKRVLCLRKSVSTVIEFIELTQFSIQLFKI